jgi:hypothetical protein
VATVAIALAFGAVPSAVSAQVRVGANDIGGVVAGPNGPEAGVWVIAETTDTPSRMTKSVVTDDQGRYLIPELPPNAKYTVWARGYGLVDSAKAVSEPGKTVNITAIAAPNAAAAAEYYPAIYWYAMLNIPDKSMFPGTGPQGNGMPTFMKSQLQWTDQIKTNGRLPVTSSATRRPASSRRNSAPSRPRSRLGSAASSPDRRCSAWPMRLAARTPSFRSPISPIGPTASPPANCPSPSPSGRKASSATS